MTNPPKRPKAGTDDRSADAAATADAAPATKTPMYLAIFAARYQRQSLIAEIQEHTGRRLVCYVAGRQASLDRDDTLGFVELLHNVTRGEHLDLLLHTGGGDMDATEKIVRMVRNAVGEAEFRVIVPDYARAPARSSPLPPIESYE